nr:hypothetical protein [Pseudomonas sp.]
MPSDAIYGLIEDVSQLITRLDARVLASPLAEAWQVRACFLAAESLASVDGTPTRQSDILRILSSTPLPSRDGYYPAMTAMGHWRRCMARVDLSELAARIVGAKPSPALQAQEEQEDWDREDRLPRAARQWSPVEILRDIDSYALRTAKRALEVMRSDEPLRGSRYLALARGLQVAVRTDPDPDYFDRIHDMREQFMADAAKAAEDRLAALPSPTEETVTQMRDQQVRWLENVQWEKKPHWGACYAVLPDRMVEMGLTTARLSCLTGATKRLGFEGRLDDRAAEGFLRKLAQEARAGLDLLDD